MMNKMELQIEHTPVFEKNLQAYEDPAIRFIINQGGSRSSKSYSILQLIIVLCLTKKQSVSVVRKTFPTLRTSIMRDFFEILKELNLYNENNHNMTEHLYTFKNGSTVEFFATVEDQKLRGKKRNILFCNEANEIEHGEFIQLAMRTTGKIFIDFNPSDTEHWIYDLINKDPKSILIKSTYKDNTFLPKEQVDYIENLINVDENYYKIYTLGEPPTATSRIYSHFKIYSELPEKIVDVVYGLDFGYNHPTVLVKTSLCEDGRVFVDEMIYESKLIISEVISKIKSVVEPNRIVFCDSARPEIIDELRRNHIQARSSDKNVKAGIDTVKSKQIFMNVNATNLWREYKLYSWKTDKDRILEEPVKLNDDGMDALRYSIHSLKKPAYNKTAVGVYKLKFR